MHIDAQPFWAQKLGNTLEEYQDACWPRRRIDRKTARFRCAVADGATETSFSGLWARRLVAAYHRGAFEPRRLERALAGMRKAWHAEVSKKPLPWFAEEKLRQGAFSSLLGFSIGEAGEPGAPRPWQSIAIGDSCLCQVRGNALLVSFPLENAAAFNSRPTLLSSQPAVRLSPSQIGEQRGAWEPGDAFFLMTDALACWFVKAAANDEKPWRILADFDAASEPARFPEWVQHLRRREEMKNDDVTLLRISVE